MKNLIMKFKTVPGVKTRLMAAEIIMAAEQMDMMVEVEWEGRIVYAVPKMTIAELIAHYVAVGGIINDGYERGVEETIRGTQAKQSQVASGEENNGIDETKVGEKVSHQESEIQDTELGRVGGV